MSSSRSSQSEPVPYPGFARFLALLEDGAILVVALALVCIMLVTVVDVVLRYVFNAPLSFAYDFIGQYLLVAAFFLALSYTLRTGGHMNVDLVVRKLRSERHRAALRLIGDAIALVLFALLVWTSGITAWDAFIAGEKVSLDLPLPVGLSRAFVPLGCLILLLRLAYRVACDIWGVAGRGARDGAEP